MVAPPVTRDLFWACSAADQQPVLRYCSLTPLEVNCENFTMILAKITLVTTHMRQSVKPYHICQQK